MSERLTVVPAVYLFLERDGTIALLRRYNTGYEDGNYQPPAGHIEPGESAAEAMIREAKEETGVVIAPVDLEFVNVTYRMNKERTGYRVDFFFRAKQWEGEVVNAEPDKCDELRWVAYDALPENTVDLIKEVVKNIRVGRGLTEYSYTNY